MLMKWNYEMNVLRCGPKKGASEASLHFDETVVTAAFWEAKKEKKWGKPHGQFACCNPQAAGFWDE